MLKKYTALYYPKFRPLRSIVFMKQPFRFPYHTISLRNTSKFNGRLPMVLATIVFLISACSGGSPPSKSYEYAVQGLYSAELSANGEHAIVGSINHGGSLWDVLTNERRYNWNHKKGDFSKVIASAFSPELQYAVTAKPQTMVLWDINSGQGLTYWKAPSQILDIALLSNGDFALLGMTDHSAALFDIKNGGVRQTFYHDGPVNSVAYHADSNTILTGSDDYSARLWNVATGEELHRWTNTHEVQLVAFSDDGTKSFTMAKYHRAAIWNTDDGSLINQLPLKASAMRRGQLFTAAVFSNDSSYLLTGNGNRLIQLWDVESMREIKKWTTPRRNSASPTSASILALAFGTNESYYAITSDGFTHQLR